MDGRVEIPACETPTEETVYVPASCVRPWMARARKAGGTVVRSSPCVVEGSDAYAVTVAYR